MKRIDYRTRTQSDKLNKPDKDGKPVYLSLKEVKEQLFLDESTIRYHIAKRRFRAFKNGGRWYLHRDDVNGYQISMKYQGKER